MLNTLASDGPHGRRFAERLEATLRGVFRVVEAQASESGPFGYSNLLLFATDGELPGSSPAAGSALADARPFVDDFNDCDIEYGLETGLRTRLDDWYSWGLPTLLYE
jgi:hypothetical protein